MDNNIITSHLLEKAQELFQQKGGAIGVTEDFEGKLCAIGALYRCTSFSPERNRMHARNILNGVAKKTYGKLLVEVNDQLGKDAVNHCYELAVKRAHEEENS
jgi:hypothetical protein